MLFPQCPASLDGLLDGHVVQRVCINPLSPAHRQLVVAPTCALCNLRPHGADVGPPPEPPSNAPSLLKRAITYANAVSEWVATGRPERDAQQTAEIYERHCKLCSRYDPANGMCRACGCRVADKGLALTNKIRMATQHCPLGKW